MCLKMLSCDKLLIDIHYRDWRDPSAINIVAVRAGISVEVQHQRRILFGDNIIDVKGKSMLSLLIEEVWLSSYMYEGVVCSFPGCMIKALHPFYVFQIASIVLWSLDDYYYYAFCIALISALSVGTTLIETKKVGTPFISSMAFAPGSCYLLRRQSKECVRCPSFRV